MLTEIQLIFTESQETLIDLNLESLPRTRRLYVKTSKQLLSKVFYPPGRMDVPLSLQNMMSMWRLTHDDVFCLQYVGVGDDSGGPRGPGLFSGALRPYRKRMVRNPGVQGPRPALF